MSDTTPQDGTPQGDNTPGNDNAARIEHFLDTVIRPLVDGSSDDNPTVVRGERLSYAVGDDHAVIRLDSTDETAQDFKALALVAQAMDVIGTIHEAVNRCGTFCAGIIYGEELRDIGAWCEMHDHGFIAQGVREGKTAEEIIGDEDASRMINIATDFDTLHYLRDDVQKIDLALHRMNTLDLIDEVVGADVAPHNAETTVPTLVDPETLAKAANAITDAAAVFAKHLQPVVLAFSDYFLRFEQPHPDTTMREHVAAADALARQVHDDLAVAHGQTMLLADDPNIAAVMNVGTALLEDAYTKDGVQALIDSLIDEGESNENSADEDSADNTDAAE